MRNDLNNSITPFHRKESETLSFRVNIDSLARLKKEAEQKQTSLNVLVNQILDFYVNFTSSASADMMPVPKVALMDLVEGYTEGQLKTHAQRVYEKVGLDIVYQLQGRYDFEAVPNVWEYKLRASGIPYKHSIDVHNKDRHTLIIQYGMGKKWSLVVAEIMKRYFEPVFFLSCGPTTTTRQYAKQANKFIQVMVSTTYTFKTKTCIPKRVFKNSKIE